MKFSKRFTVRAALVIAAGGFLKVWHDMRGIARTAEATHVIVNSQRTDMMAKIDALKALLADKERRDRPRSLMEE